jgi:hypothetical protein
LVLGVGGGEIGARGALLHAARADNMAVTARRRQAVIPGKEFAHACGFKNRLFAARVYIIYLSDALYSPLPQAGEGLGLGVRAVDRRKERIMNHKWKPVR